MSLLHLKKSAGKLGSVFSRTITSRTRLLVLNEPQLSPPPSLNSPRGRSQQAHSQSWQIDWMPLNAQLISDQNDAKKYKKSTDGEYPISFRRLFKVQKGRSYLQLHYLVQSQNTHNIGTIDDSLSSVPWNEWSQLNFRHVMLLYSTGRKKRSCSLC